MITAPGAYYIFRGAILYRDGNWVRSELGPDLDYIGSSNLDHVARGQRPDLVRPDYLSYGDGFGDSVERSNNQAFREQFAHLQGTEWWNLYGMIGLNNGLVIRADADERHEDIAEFFNALENYPIADDDLHSQIEMENQQAQWDDYARREFGRMLLGIIDDGDSTFTTALNEPDSGTTDEILWQTWHMLAEITNTQLSEEPGGGVRWQFDRVLEPVKKLVDTYQIVNPKMIDPAVLPLVQDRAGKDYNGGIYKLWRAIHYADAAMLMVASDLAHERGDPEAGLDFLVKNVRDPWSRGT